MSDLRIAERTNFLGIDGIVKGEDWTRVAHFQTLNADGSVSDYDMSAYQPSFGGQVRGSVRLKTGAEVFSTNDGNLTLTWLSNSRLEIAISADDNSAVSRLPNTTVIEIEGVRNTGEDTKILKGRIEMKDEDAIQDNTP